MILKNAKIYAEGTIHTGALLIGKGIIKSIKFNPSEEDIKNLEELNKHNIEIDCESKLILPGIIDIHAHLRDMEQSEKETFRTGTKAAACAGITTVFNMPNTKPPAIDAQIIKKWMEKAQNNIYIDVGFIAGVPKGINHNEIKEIVDLGVFGFKIYPVNPIDGIDWKDPTNILNILSVSSEYQIPIFIHPEWSLADKEIKHNVLDYTLLVFHDRLHPVDAETKYVKFILDNYMKFVTEKKLKPQQYPIVHFCHISAIESCLTIQRSLSSKRNLKITFEATPHHLLLSNKIDLKNVRFGKVLPPLRNEKHCQFLMKELCEGRIELIGTDHAPHTLEEKSLEFRSAPAGFPGFETYPLLLLNKVFRYELSLENFVKAASENPATRFNLKNKGFVKEGYDADLLIIDKVPEYAINSQAFKTKAKFTPYENFKTSVQIWKVFLRGFEINVEDSEPKGRIIKRSE